jgi:hypothetical protein
LQQPLFSWVAAAGSGELAPETTWPFFSQGPENKPPPVNKCF